MPKAVRFDEHGGVDVLAARDSQPSAVASPEPGLPHDGDR